MAEERFAGIDIGSNSVKLLITERKEDGSFVALSETVYVTRLGEGFHAQRLGEPAIRRTLDAIREFVRICSENGVTAAAAVGTSALREASNQREFLDRAAEMGITIEAISGEEEARLSYLAVRRDELWKRAPNLYVIDIGGGSTEVIHGIGSTEYPASRLSLALGAVRLTEAELRSDPPTVVQLTRAYAAADVALSESPTAKGTYIPVGVGGTVANLAAVKLGMLERDVERLHGAILSLTDIESQITLYAARTVEERKQIPGLNPARADIILGGAIILFQTMNHLGFESVHVSCRGLRWGLLYDRFGKHTV